MSVPQLFLIDAHSLCYRSYFAIKGLTNSKGQSTNAVYGFLNTLRKILRTYNPAYMAVCFDSREKTQRQERYAEYKIQRPSMPDDLIPQISLIKEVVRAYRLNILEVSGFEADDLIATLVRKECTRPVEKVIVTDDKDMFQLLGDGVKIFSVRKDKVLDYAEIKDTLGFDPRRMPDFIGLAGDSVDNIPGVRGIGEVTARQLMSQFGSLEDMLNHAESVTSVKVREKLTAGREIALLSRELALLMDQAPVNCDLEDLKVESPDESALLKLFQELEFRSLVKEFSDRSALPGKAVAASFNHDINVMLKEDVSDKDIEELTACIRKAKRCVLWPQPKREEGLFESHRVFIGVGDNVYALTLEQCEGVLELIKDPAIIKVTCDIKEVWKLFKSRQWDFGGEWFDCLLVGYLLMPAGIALNVTSLAWEFLKISVMNLEQAPHVSAALMFRLYPEMLKQLREKELHGLFTDVELPLAYVLSEMEYNGVNLDTQWLSAMSRECDERIKKLHEQLYTLAGGEFNLNSPKQLGDILFKKLQLPALKKTKTGFSTNEEVLIQLKDVHPLPALILEYRQLAKLKSTYIDALPKMIDPSDGRLHTNFNQTVTETGRLSSNNPNLQNIPIRTDMGRKIRKAFIPYGKNDVLVSADYSQIELRVLAHMSGDSGLIEAFQTGQDIHNFTASQIFDIPEDKVDFHMRDTAKRVNFGIIYGISAFGLSKDLGVSQKEAQTFIEKYFSRYPDVRKFMNDQIQKAEINGYVTTLLNRRRYIPEIHSKNIGLRQFAQRQAINTPVQGSAADLIKLAMINIHKDMHRSNLSSTMMLTVHDDLVFNVVPGELDEMQRLVKHAMEHAIALRVPVKVCMKTGKNWLDMEPSNIG